MRSVKERYVHICVSRAAERGGGLRVEQRHAYSTNWGERGGYKKAAGTKRTGREITR